MVIIIFFKKILCGTLWMENVACIQPKIPLWIFKIIRQVWTYPIFEKRAGRVHCDPLEFPLVLSDKQQSPSNPQCQKHFKICICSTCLLSRSKQNNDLQQEHICIFGSTDECLRRYRMTLLLLWALIWRPTISRAEKKMPAAKSSTGGFWYVLVPSTPSF